MTADVFARRTSPRVGWLAAGMLLLVSAGSAQGPLLRASAKAPQWIAGLAAALDVQLPPLADGQRLELLVDAEGAACASAVPAPAGLAGERLLQVELRPAAWLAHAGLPHDEAPRSARNRAVAIGQLLGLTPRQSGSLAEALWARLHELDRCELGVTAGDGDRPARLDLLATPRPASEFANWLLLLRPAERQAPTWAWPRALLQVRLQLACADLAAVAAPFLPWWSAIAGAPPEVLTERLASHDGRLAFVVDEAQWGLVTGLRDVEAFAARWRADGSASDPDEDTPTTRQPAAPYREVELLRTRHRGRQPIPRYGDADGTVEAFGGIVGTHWVQVAGQKAREGTERAIDDALAGRLLGSADRDPAPTGWLSLDLDVQALQARWSGETARTGDVRQAHLEFATERAPEGPPRLRISAAWR